MRTRVSALVLAAGLVIVAVAPVGAQTSGPVASGDFVGWIGIHGSFTYTVDEGYTTVVVIADGPLELTLDEGTMSGSWGLDGGTTTFGSFGDGVVAIHGGGPLSGSGPFGGPPTDYRMSGSVTSTNTVTVSVGGVINRSATNTSTDTVDEQLTDVIVLCDTIVGRWDLRIKQQIEEAGFDERIRGYFTATTGIDATEQAQQVEDLLNDISEWVGGENEVLAENTNLYIGTGLGLLNSVQQLQTELAAPTPCPPDPRFATQLTLGVQDVLTALVARLPGVTTSHLVALGFGSGAIGSGSPVPDRAAEVTELLKADIQAKWDDLVASGATMGDLLDTARAAQMLGIEQLGDGGLTPQDVIIVIGDDV